MKAVLTLEERFWSKVIKTDTCWLWTGYVDYNRSNHYGTFYIKRKPFAAHRVSYELEYGPIPENYNVGHSCDNPSCVRPSHLFICTQGENLRDACKKGRMHQGEDCYISKLTESDVLAIRRRFKPWRCTHRQLSIEYGVSIGTIRDILDRKTWRHLGS